MEGALDLTDQVGQKDKTPLQEPEYEQVPVGIRGGDFGAHLAHATRNRLTVVGDALHRPTEQSRIEGVSRRERRCVGPLVSSHWV